MYFFRLLGILAFPFLVNSNINLPRIIRSTAFQLVAEQAKLRQWRAIYLTGSGGVTEHTELVQVFSKNWIKSCSNLELDLKCSEKYGFVCVELNNSSQCSVTSATAPWLIVISKTREETLKLEMQVSSNVRFDSDVLLAVYDGKTFANGEIWPNSVALKQVFKIHSKAELTIVDLGFWKPGDAMPNVIPIESRRASKQYKVRIGIKNFTNNVDKAKDEEEEPNRRLTAFVEKEEDTYIFELIRCLILAINISYETVSYAKTGWRNDEGAWTHLLGAVADGQVDIGADTVDMSLEEIRTAVLLTNPIVLSMSSVYHRKPEGVRVRDVFTSTFSLPLQFSVFGTVLLLWSAMLLVTFVSVRLKPVISGVRSKDSNKDCERLWEPSEALMWIVSVVCMQGSPWSPKSASGCLLLLFSLIFGLIIFNSFAAFITSILSVRDNSIKSVQDLLSDEFSFGYPKNSAEEHFLRTTGDKELLSLYYRGLVSGGGVPDIGEGMLRVTDQRFAFFASARIARRVLHSLVPQRSRCDLMELSVPGTVTAAAIPISKTSPYNKAFQFWLLHVRQTGILHRIKSRLLPPMPACSAWQNFSGVRASDLKVAYSMYMLGLCASWVILLGEILWSKRKTFFKRRRHSSTETTFELSVAARRYQMHNIQASRPFWGATDFVN